MKAFWEKGNYALEIQAKIDSVMKFMHNNDESADNIKKFTKMLQNLGADIEIISTYQTSDEIMNLSIVSQAFKCKKLKVQFLECILKIIPKSLYEEYRTLSYTIQLLTPLRLSIKNRSFDMVETVLNHEIFNSHINQNPEEAIDQIFRSYMYALRWYDKTKELFSFKSFCNDSGLSQVEIKDMYANQPKILKKLRNKCKEAIIVARKQGKGEISKKLIHTFLADGIGGEAFSMHGQPELLSAQVRAMTEICKEGLNKEELDAAKKKGLVVDNKIVLDLIELRVFLQSKHQETPGNITKLKNLLEELHKHLGAVVFLDLLNVYGRGYKDKDHKIVSAEPIKFNLGELAYYADKKAFSQCIKDFEDRLKNNIEKTRLHNNLISGVPPIATNQVLGSAAIPISIDFKANITYSQLVVAALCCCFMIYLNLEQSPQR